MFIRTKKIKNKEYAYLVENKWTKKGSRQKVKKYLGKIIKAKRILQNNYLIDDQKTYQTIINELIKYELDNHKIKNNTSSVIAMNEGFLCKETITKLLHLKNEKKQRIDKEGEKLANSLLEAGLQLKKEEFSKLFETWKKTNT